MYKCSTIHTHQIEYYTILFHKPKIPLKGNIWSWSWHYGSKAYCNILTFDPAVNQETGASGQRYQDITLTVDGLSSVQMRRSQEAGGRQTII